MNIFTENAYILKRIREDCLAKKSHKAYYYKVLEQGEVVTPASKNYPANRKEFDLDTEVIMEF